MILRLKYGLELKDFDFFVAAWHHLLNLETAVSNTITSLIFMR